MSNTPFFVYGTLKRGFYNARRIPDSEIEKVTRAIIQGMDMYSVGSFPAIVHGEGTVVGEVIFLKEDADYDRILRDVDHLEGEGYLYKRKLSTVILGDGTVVEAWTYIWNQPTHHLIPLKDGVWNV